VKTTIYILFLGVSAAFGADPTEQPANESSKRIPVLTESLNTTHQLIGPIGKPIGEVLTLTITVTKERSKGDFKQFVTVTSVGETKLSDPVTMPAELWKWGNIEKLALGQKLTVRAYQDAGMTGRPDQAMRETVYVQTRAHTFETWLVILYDVNAKK